MNKKGNILFSFMIFMFLFFAGVMFINFITDDITLTRSSQNLNCQDTTISDGAKVTCLGIDLVVPYILVGVLSIGGTLVVNKFNL